jgi:hypothetical protein
MLPRELLARMNGPLRHLRCRGDRRQREGRPQDETAAQIEAIRLARSVREARPELVG